MSDDPKQDEIIDIEPQVIEEPQSRPASSGAWTTARIAGLCVGVGVVCALGGGWFYRDYLSSYLPSDQLQAMQMRLDALQVADKDNQKRADAFVALTEELKAQLGAAQSASEKSAKQNADTASLAQANAQAVADLKVAVDQLKTQVANGAGVGAADPALASRLDALEKQIANLNVGAPKSANIDVPAINQAFSALKSKIDQGAPYAPEFASLQALVPAAAGMDVISAEADKGLPNAQTLAVELAALAGNAPKPAEPAAQSSSWMPDITGYLSSLITIKDVGENDAGVVSAQALAALQAGDLQKASDAISSATVPLPAAFNDWQDRLKRRLKLEQAEAALAAGLSHLPQVKG